jgi:hypothetical protein
MNLWCDVHGRNHHYTPGETERIAYTLQAALADAESKGQVFDRPTLICLDEAVGWSNDMEGYSEHVEALRERRRATERGAQ